jgi:hypothetical protein
LTGASSGAVGLAAEAGGDCRAREAPVEHLAALSDLPLLAGEFVADLPDAGQELCALACGRCRCGAGKDVPDDLGGQSRAVEVLDEGDLAYGFLTVVPLGVDRGLPAGCGPI